VSHPDRQSLGVGVAVPVSSSGNFPRRLRPRGLSEYRKIDDAAAGDAVNVAGNYERDGFYRVRAAARQVRHRASVRASRRVSTSKLKAAASIIRFALCALVRASFCESYFESSSRGKNSRTRPDALLTQRRICVDRGVTRFYLARLILMIDESAC